jgi:hypothetical protein
MGQIVPRFKLIAEVRRLESELFHARQQAAKEGRTLTREEVRDIAQRTVDEGDNHYGQMIYDNLGMNRAAKDVLAMWIGFPGWNLGSFRTIKNAMLGLIHPAKEGPKYLGDVAAGRPAEWHKMKPEHLHGIEFFIGLTLVTAIGGAIINRLLTGEWPVDHRDLFMPRTGGVMGNGMPERVRLPSYMKDVLALNHPIDMVAHKQAFPLRLFSSFVANQDYFGEQIYDPWASFGERQLQKAEYLGKSLLPFGIQGWMKSETPASKALNLVGITPNPRQYSNTEAQNIIDEYNQMARATTTTKESAALTGLKKDLRKLAKAGDESGFQVAAQEAMQSGQITKQQVQELIDESQLPPGLNRFVRLPIEWAMRAFDQATPAEKEIWTPYMLKKIMGEKPERIVKYKDHIAETLASLGLADAAQKVLEFSIPEERGQFPDLAALGVAKPVPEMGELGDIDLAIGNAIERNLLGKEKKTSFTLRTPNPMKKKKKNPYELLGL